MAALSIVLVLTCAESDRAAPPVSDRDTDGEGAIAGSPNGADNRGAEASAQTSPLAGRSAIEAPPRRRVSGSVLHASGRPAGGASVRITFETSPRSQDLERTANQSGAYAASLPASEGRLEIRAEAPGGYHGSLEVDLPGSPDDVTLPDLVLARTLRLDLALEIDEAAHRILQTHGDVELAVYLEPVHARRGLGVRDRGREVARFRSADGRTQKRTLEVTIEEDHRLTWVSLTPHAPRMTVKAEAIPADVDAVASTCTVSMKMLLFGSVARRSGGPVPQMALEALSLSIGRMFTVQTGDEGRFALIVPENAFGTITARNNDRCDKEKWTAGVPVALRCALGGVASIRLVDPQGRPVTSYDVRTTNHPHRDGQGEIPAGGLTDAPSGIQLLPAGVKAGDLLYIHVPGVGELIQPWQPGPGNGGRARDVVADPARAAHGDIVVTRKNADRQQGPMAIHLVSRGTPAHTYTFVLDPQTEREHVWQARYIHPGRHEYDVQYMGATFREGTVEVVKGGSGDVEVVL